MLLRDLWKVLISRHTPEEIHLRTLKSAPPLVLQWVVTQYWRPQLLKSLVIQSVKLLDCANRHDLFWFS
jgi:hypothetical protein